MTGELTVGLIVAGASVVLVLLVAWIRWSIRDAVEHVVNGRIEKVAATVGRIETWTESHDRRHDHDRRQTIAALQRQGLEPPDGWLTPPDRTEGP